MHDLHVAVISGSLGIPGGELCSPSDPRWTPEQNEQAHLVSRGTEGSAVTGPAGGVVSWTGYPPYAGDPAVLLEETSQRVRGRVLGVGEQGCPIQSPLEATYRFVADPAPRILWGPDAGAIDQALIDERAAFLRDGAPLVVAVISDDDDCSIADAEAGAAIGSPVGVPEEPFSEGTSGRVAARCFGYASEHGPGFLQPLERYTESLWLDGAAQHRYLELHAIAGVPWQDLVYPWELGDASLRYADLAGLDWGLVFGDGGAPPEDPFLSPSVLPRPASAPHPVTGDRIAAPEAGPRASAINGHERAAGAERLQDACVFDLPEPVDCAAADGACPCDEAARAAFDVRCQAEDGSYGALQLRDGVRPAPRIVELTRDMWAGGLGSACPKPLPADAGRDRGYFPAFQGLFERLRCSADGPDGQWFPRDPGGRVSCRLVEVRRAEDAPACERPGRRYDAELARVARVHEADRGACGDEAPIPCDALELCEIEQLEGEARRVCQTDTGPYPLAPESDELLGGFCWFDEQTSPEALFGTFCPYATHGLRILGEPTLTSTRLWYFCQESGEPGATNLGQ